MSQYIAVIYYLCKSTQFEDKSRPSAKSGTFNAAELSICYTGCWQYTIDTDIIKLQRTCEEEDEVNNAIIPLHRTTPNRAWQTNQQDTVAIRSTTQTKQIHILSYTVHTYWRSLFSCRIRHVFSPNKTIHVTLYWRIIVNIFTIPNDL